ncbi:MAG: hypothetical protein JSV85_07610 [Candidatus Bathyarchaeota archaeon]|nr:MAG: hypothetical protein JSV85_07610 [Candidatus Bathyarchaeota archaeon]
MKASNEKIALATASGKAYYELVKELKQRKIPFVSLKPGDVVPFSIKVVITTQGERHLVNHSDILVFEGKMKPTPIVDEAIRIAQGKQSYDRVIVGIDPGKTFGIALLADGRVLETATGSSLEETVDIVLELLGRTPAMVDVVKVGNGAPLYAEGLVHSLDKSLPKEAVIETISEVGTSHFTREIVHQRGSRDMMSAIKIAERNGRVLRRRKRTH